MGKHLKKSLLIAIALLLNSVAMLAADEYNEMATIVKTTVWGWNNPEFKNYTVPDKYKDESAVLLAVREEIYANRKTNFRLSSVSFFALHKEMSYTHTVRKMVKINDKASLDNYSSLSFRDKRTRWGLIMTSKYQTFVGARVIKQDGTITDVDISKDAVTVEEGDDNKKVAIPNLQVGDILDYYICDINQIDTENPPISNIVLGSNYPILSYSVHCDIGSNLTTEYRSINGAPEFVSSIDEDGDIMLDMKRENIAKFEGIDMWVSPYRQLPMIRLSIKDNKNSYIWHPKSARPEGLHKDVPASDIIMDERYIWGGKMNYNLSPIYRESAKMVKDYVKANPNVSKDSLALYIYDALHYNLTLYDNYYFNFQRALSTLLAKYKIEHKFAITTSRMYGSAENNIFSTGDLYTFLLANNNTQILTLSNWSNFAGETDPDYGGETAMTFANFKFGSKMIEGTQGSYQSPISAPEDNLEAMKISVSLSDDPTILDIKADTRALGALKAQDSPYYYTMEKWQQEMRSRLKLEGTFEEFMDTRRRLRKEIDDYSGRIEQGKKDLDDRIKTIVSAYHDADPKEIINYEVKHLGITPQNPALETSVHYLQEGLVQRAGANYILNAGKLIGKNLDLKGDDRKRNLDMYFPSTRMFEHEIEIQIPQGYTVEEVSNLNTNADNEVASFHSSATIEGNIVKIKAVKTYKTIFQPVENWDKLLQILDATVNFCAQSIILKKL